MTIPTGTTRPAATGTRPLHVAMVSTFPPTQCGLATFTAALSEHMAALPEVASVGIVRAVERPLPRPSPDVVGELVEGSAASTREALRLLDRHDVVVLQHEYGIFGGTDGREVLDLVEALDVPLVTVLHTVLEQPTAGQREVLLRVVAASSHVVTMTRTARDRLVAVYGTHPSRVSVVPHGAPDHRAVGPSVRAGLDPARRPTVLTWGLLGPGKGIEWAVDAMASLRDLAPRYLVLGKTHPKVMDRSGDVYREGLVARAAARGVGDLVEFDASYLGVDELARVVAAADVVLLPYDSVEQVTSGVLIEAVAAGRPVVSTAFPHAVELLGDGTGLLVPREDPDALAAALRRVLSEPGLAGRMQLGAEAKAPDLVWSAVAARYAGIARSLVEARELAEHAPLGAAS